jgi:hypothetical protein
MVETHLGMLQYWPNLKRILVREVHLEQCANLVPVPHFYVASRIPGIAARLILLTSLFPDGIKAKEWRGLPVFSSNEGQGVCFA